jgi:hypothetical protein
MSEVTVDPGSLAPLHLLEWEDCRLSWQLMCQVVGKVRLDMHPFMNHWWHAPLYVSPSGLTTGAVPFAAGVFEIELDAIRHKLCVSTSQNQRHEFRLEGISIQEFYNKTINSLSLCGIHPQLKARPFKCKSTVPFDEDLEHFAYSGARVHRAWAVLTQIEPVFKQFRGRFIGKCSPVHMFWHSFDLAVTRFSGRRAPEMPGADPVTREAYSHEVNSAGFWFGDDDLPEPAFYCYSAPSPKGLAEEPLAPEGAVWMVRNGSPMAILKYEAWRKMGDPAGALLNFLQSSYEAGARCANWDREALEK